MPATLWFGRLYARLMNGNSSLFQLHVEAVERSSLCKCMELNWFVPHSVPFISATITWDLSKRLCAVTPCYTFYFPKIGIFCCRQVKIYVSRLENEMKTEQTNKTAIVLTDKSTVGHSLWSGWDKEIMRLNYRTDCDAPPIESVWIVRVPLASRMQCTPNIRLSRYFTRFRTFPGKPDECPDAYHSPRILISRGWLMRNEVSIATTSHCHIQTLVRFVSTKSIAKNIVCFALYWFTKSANLS